MSDMAFLAPGTVLRPPSLGQRPVAVSAAIRRSQAAFAQGSKQTDGSTWRLTSGIASGLALRFLATRRRAYGDYGGRGGGGGRGYGGNSRPSLSPHEQAARTEAKRQREARGFWDVRARLAGAGPIVRDDRYWNYEEKRLFRSAHVSKGIDFDKYDNISVEKTGGQGTEKSVESFAELCEMFNVPEELSANLVRCGYDVPTPVQKHSMPAAMVGSDVMCSAQTGSGKTAAFLVPTLNTTLQQGPQIPDDGPVCPTCVILAPTRELCQQIVAEAKRLCFKTTARTVGVYGGADAMPQLHELAEGCDVLVATPGRLEDFLNRGVVSMEKVKRLTLDEADRMLDMGFEPQIRKIVEEHGMPEPGLGDDERQTTMFSATFPREMQDMALDFLDPGYMWIAVGQVGSVNSNVDQHFVDVSREDKFQALLRCFNEVTDSDGNVAKTLIFANQKALVDDISWRLSEEKIRAAPIHGGLTQPARDRAISALKTGRIQALVATDVAARGLDLPGIGHVVNFDLPMNSEDYVHRIGRTGRIGNRGRATSMVGYNEGALKDIVRCLQDARREDESIPEVPQWMEEQAFNSGGGGGRSRGGRGSAPPPF